MTEVFDSCALTDPLAGARIVLIVTGGIACYKACECVRLFKRAGSTVRVVMTEAACAFVTPLTFEAISGQKVHLGQFDDGIAHIDLAREADLMIVAPATANTIAKIATGLADNLATSTVLAAACPVAVVPAMNVNMWHAAPTQRNMRRIQEDGRLVWGPADGELACGTSGEGRMIEAAQIVEYARRALTPKPLAGRTAIVTAGPTFEAIDPVRAVTNLSSGKQGYEVARALATLGADVTLISGPTALSAPLGVRRVEVRSVADMLAALETGAERIRDEHGRDVDLFVSVAAVCDWRIANASDEKIKKGIAGLPQLELAENPDILAGFASSHPDTVCVGFAAETEHVIEHATLKRTKKHCAMIVGNDAKKALGADSNALIFVTGDGVETLPEMSKAECARAIALRCAALLGTAR
ncbi:MAG: bifunctional phosphopantothenoylcysteine decarboxylase/phosphopantothenate--cysteine ligase CoaBC [Duodenibacillus sp.]